MKTFHKILVFLFLEGKKSFYGLFLAVVAMAVLDMIGIASIFPFLKVISDSSVIQENTYLNFVYHYFHFRNRDSFLIVLGLFSFFLLVLNNILRARVMVALIQFSYLKRYFLSKVLLQKYLYEPYVFFLNRNTSELTSYLVSQIAQVVSGVLIPVLQVFARLLMALLVIALLFAVNPMVAFVVTAIIGGGYAVTYGLLRNMLSQIGTDMTVYSKAVYKSLAEAFGGIKDIKILGKEQVFVESFSGSIQKLSKCYAKQFIIFQLPRYVFEILVFGGILFIAILVAVFQKNYQNVIPIVGLYAFAAYRLMPTLQQIYQDVANISSSLHSLNVVYEDYAACSDTSAQLESVEKKIDFGKNIEIRNVTFKYPKADKPVIKNLSLIFNANTTVGLVGATGAGKTTILDIMLGLLSPQQGEVVVGGIPLDVTTFQAWRKNIGYVPQNIYLCDDTVTRNIAFGVPDKDIDFEAVRRAANLASIHDFIAQELPCGYESEVGEKGIRLSGGQRQRIGIARALYHNPSILLLDEATSALDGITEDTILEAIRKLAHQKTIILIAHRLSTVKECEVIYLLEHGKLIAHGSYQQLLISSEQFRRMAKIREIHPTSSTPAGIGI